MSDNLTSAIANLKAKLAATIAADDAKKVALTNFTAGSAVTSYVGSPKNIDWDPKDHPRDPNTGEFVKTPGGYMWGKTKKADFGLKNNKSLSLQPGDVAFKTPAGNIAVSHADGSWSLHNKVSGNVNKVPGGTSNTVITSMQAKGELTKVGENPGVALATNSLVKAEKMLTAPSDFKVMNDGTPMSKDYLKKEESAFPEKPSSEFTEDQWHFWTVAGTGSSNVLHFYVPTSVDKATALTKAKTQYFEATGHLTPTGKPFKSEKVKAEGVKGAEISTLVVEDSDPTAYKGVQAIKDGKQVGALVWIAQGGGLTTNYPESKWGEVHYVQVDEAHQKQGIATQMWEAAKKIDPALKHAPVEAQSESGKAFAQKTAAKPSYEPAADLPTPPSLKPGKTAYTAKQIAEWQEQVKGMTLAVGKDGKEIKSGTWVDIDGKPYLVHASPYMDKNKGSLGEQPVTVYRWVSTKQQASNLPKEDIWGLLDLKAAAVSIEDPTGKPYGVSEVAPEEVTLKHGSIMSHSVVGSIPNTSVKHKVFVEKAAGKVISVPVEHEGKTHPLVLTAQEGSQKGAPIKSGDWVEIDGKPFQIHQSPNDGNVAMAKWVSTKQKKSNNTYDFPALAILNSGLSKIEDPTGTDYTPAAEKTTTTAPEGKEIGGGWALKSVEEVEPEVADEFGSLVESPNYDKVKNAKSGDQIQMFDGTVWTKQSSGDWWNGNLFLGDEVFVSGDYEFIEKKVSLPTAVEAVFAGIPQVGDAIMAYNGTLTWTYGPDSMWHSKNEGASQPPYTSGSLKALLETTSQQGDLGLQVVKAPVVTEKDTVYYDGKTYSLMSDGSWQHLNNSSISYEEQHAIQEHYDKQKQMIEEIQNLAPGDLLHSEVLATGKTGTLIKQGDGYFMVNDGIKQIPVSVVKSNLLGEQGFKNKVWTEKVKKVEYSPTYLQSPIAGDRIMFVAPSGLIFIYTKQSDESWIQSAPPAEHSFADKHMKVMTEGYSGEIFFLPMTKILSEPAGEQQKTPKGNVFVHPVSGVEFPLSPGDTVFKHDKTPNAYIIVTEQGDKPINFFTQHGKLQKPKESQKNLSKAYSIDENWPGHHDDSGAVPEINIQPTVDMIVSATEGDFLTVSMVTFEKTYTKQADGKWSITGTDGLSTGEPLTTDFVLGMFNTYPDKFTFTAADAVLTKPALKYGDVMSKTDLADLPAGEQLWIKHGISEFPSFTKNADGNWINDDNGFINGSLKALVGTGIFIYGPKPEKAPGLVEKAYDDGNNSNEVMVNLGTQYSIETGAYQHTITLQPGDTLHLYEDDPAGEKEVFAYVKHANGTYHSYMAGISTPTLMSESEFHGNTSSAVVESALQIAEYEEPAGPPVEVGMKKGTYTFPNGHTITLKPGEALASAEYMDGTYIFHVNSKPKSDPSNANAMYTLGGVVTDNPKWKAYKNWDVASLKKRIKQHGGEILGEKKFPTVKNDEAALQELGEVVEVDTEYGYASQTNMTKSRFNSIITVWSGGSIPYYQKIPNTDSTWGEADIDLKLSVIQKFKKPAADFYVTSHAWGEQYSDNEITKNKNRMALIFRAAVLAEELQNPDSEKDDDWFDAELSFLGQKAQKPGTTLGTAFKNRYPISEFVDALGVANQQRVFKKSLKELDFDPYDASPEEYDAYAKENGFDYLGGLTEDQQKVWVLAHLGDPTVTPSQKNDIESTAKAAKTKAVVAAFAASLDKEADLPTAQPPVLLGIADKLALKSWYKWENSSGNHHVEKVDDDEWDYYTSGQFAGKYTDALVQSVLNVLTEQGTEFTQSDSPAYGSGSVKEKLDALAKKHGVSDWPAVPDSVLQKIVAAEGGVGTSSYTSMSDMRWWLIYHASGDQIAKFALEKTWYGTSATPHPSAEHHAGSPESPAGSLAHHALAAKLKALPSEWAEKYLSGTFKTQDLDAFYKDFPDYSHDSAAVKTLFGTGNSHAAGYLNWRTAHPASDIPTTPKFGASPDTSVAQKPSNVSDEAWDMVGSITDDTDLSMLVTEDILSFPETKVAADLGALGGEFATYGSSIPTPLKRLALWANGQKSNDTVANDIVLSILAKAKAGEYLQEQTPVWVAPNGTKFPISPGATVWKYTDYYSVSYTITGPPDKDGKFTSGFVYDKNGGTVPANKYALEMLHTNDSFAKIFEMPAPVQWDQAKTDNPDFEESFWKYSEKIEAGTPPNAYTSAEHGPSLTAVLKSSDILQSEYPNLYAQHKVLPETVRQAMHAALQYHDSHGPSLLKILEYKASKGHYASLQTVGLYDPAQPWLPNLSLGQVDNESVMQHWTPEAKSAYLAFYSLTDASQIAEHLDSLINPSYEAISKALPKFDELTLTATGKSLGGMHTKYHYVDQDGNEWMTKGFDSDPNSKARIEAETAGMQISRLFGFRAPVANAQKVKGKYVYLQHLAPVSGDLVGKGPNDLPLKQLQQTMEEHLLDWLISNHDSHQENFKIDKGGNVFGIDKGQAFKHFPNDKLAVGYLPPENGAPVWYDKFYKGVKNGSISKQTADEVVKHVLRRAQKISKSQDDEFKAELEFALGSRTFWPDQYPSKDQFISALIERKHNAFDDFVDFYKSVYKDSPYEWDIDTENLVPPMLDEHTHIAVSPDLSQDIFKAGIHGKALFFHSSDLEDSHVMFSKVTGPDGQPMLTGETKVRKDADQILTNWLKQQTIENQTGYQTQTYVPPAPDLTELHKVMPQNEVWFSALVAGSKTVSSHNKSGDQSYNLTTLSNMDDIKKKMDNAAAQINDWETAHPGMPFNHTLPGVGAFEFKTMEQHDAFKSMLDTYMGYYDNVISKKGTTEKVTPHFQQFTYTPSKKANEEYDKILNPEFGGSIALLKTEVGTAKWQKVEGEKKWALVSSDSPTAVLGATVDDVGMKSLMESPEVLEVTFAEPSEPDIEIDSEVTVKVGTKVLKVIHKTASTKAGKLNEDGDLVMTNSDTTTFDFGNMYEIDFGNTVIEYRPWEGSNVAKAQQGLLRFRKKDWNADDSESIDEVLDVLRHMGLDLTPADEESMELFYWKHMSYILRDRKDRNDAKWKPVLDSIDKSYSANPNMSLTEELEAFRTAWALAWGADVVEKANWKPQFSRMRPQALSKDDTTFTAGKPYWMRPDFTYAELRKIMGDKRAPASSLKHSGDALKIAKSGAYMSSEERYRVLSAGFVQGWSSGADATSYGSSAGVYIRQNMEYGWTGGYSEQAYYHPRVLMRSHNYSFTGDNYGNIAEKSNSAHFDLTKAASIKQGSNETMVKNAASVLDDIAVLRFDSESSRQAAIKYYKDRGIFTIHGLPLEEIFVTSLSGVKKVYDHLWNQLISEEKGGN